MCFSSLEIMDVWEINQKSIENVFKRIEPWNQHFRKVSRIFMILITDKSWASYNQIIVICPQIVLWENEGNGDIKIWDFWNFKQKGAQTLQHYFLVPPCKEFHSLQVHSHSLSQLLVTTKECSQWFTNLSLFTILKLHSWDLNSGP
jgi:hypothetical protein